MKRNPYNIKTESYIKYKKMIWSKGLFYHNGALFFSYELVRGLPLDVEALRANSPCFLIAEFPDTIPIQIGILNIL